MSKRSQQDWVDGALQLLREGGVEAVRIEPLAKRLGVSKGSFYWHFDNRSALLHALLEQWEALGTSEIIDTVERRGGDHRARLLTLARVSCTADDTDNAVEVSIRAWAQSDPTANEAVARVDQRRLDFVVRLLVSAGLARGLARRRALLFYRAIIGGSTWQLAGGPTPSARELEELTDLLLARPSGSG